MWLKCGFWPCVKYRTCACSGLLQGNIVIILNIRQANYWRFRGAGSRAGNNDHDRRTSCFHGVHRQHFRGKTLWKCIVWENSKKTFRKTNYSLAFHGARRQSTNMFSLRSPLYALVILCETAWKCGFRAARENYWKTFRKRSYTLAFPSNRKTIDEHHVFMAFTVSNSLGKRFENAAFAR